MAISADFYGNGKFDFYGGLSLGYSNQISTIGGLAAGVKTYMACIGTSIESGTSGVAWPQYLRVKLPNLVSAPDETRWNFAIGGSNYADGAGNGIAETQLTNAMTAFGRVSGPKVLIVGFGFNDLSGSGLGTPADFVAYWDTIRQTAWAAGVAVVFAGPLVGSSKSITQIIVMDRLLSLYCTYWGIPYIHMASCTALPTTGLPDSALSDGTVHPNAPGARLIANEAFKVLTGAMQSVSPWLQWCRPDYIGATTSHGLSLIDNGRSQNSSVVATVDNTGWTNDTTGGTLTTAAATAPQKGFGRILTRTGAGALQTRRDSVAYDFTAGTGNVSQYDILMMGLWYSGSSLEANNTSFRVNRQPKFKSTQTCFEASVDATGAVFVDSFQVVDVTATGLRVFFDNLSSASAGVATIGGLSCVNVTKLAAWGGIDYVLPA